MLSDRLASVDEAALANPSRFDSCASASTDGSLTAFGDIGFDSGDESCVFNAVLFEVVVLEPGLELVVSAFGGLAAVKNRPPPDLVRIEYVLRVDNWIGGDLTLANRDAKDMVSGKLFVHCHFDSKSWERGRTSNFHKIDIFPIAQCT